MKKKQKDKYDKHIEDILSGEKDIFESWINADPLFKFCGAGCSSCLTMVRYGDPGPKGLTMKIRRDTRIPRNVQKLLEKFNAAKTKREKAAVLKPFAEWQRILDKKFGEGRQSDC